MTPGNTNLTQLRNKVNFDMNPTNLQAYIMATGCCNFWVIDVELVKSKPENTVL